MCSHHGHDHQNKPMTLDGWLLILGFIGLTISVAIEQTSKFPEIGRIGKIVFIVIFAVSVVITWVTGENPNDQPKTTKEVEDEETH